MDCCSLENFVVPVGTLRTPSIDATELHTFFILLKKESHQKSQFTNLVTFFYKFLGSTYFWGSFTNYVYSNGVWFVLLYEYSEFFQVKMPSRGSGGPKRPKICKRNLWMTLVPQSQKKTFVIPIFVGDCLSIFIALDYYKTYKQRI